ncbi:hypothetical protein [Helicobacter trogontum]|uniref:Uncharacterized protein n=1 Tax=Helicobacter trogontum TaxID=50960 RepID=A0A4U8SBC5_9HELI|nr:hypothetical protein [Helicobacter trogontum]TLD83349.1 hypothetical protein LS81_005275 [Helicobacter trogontum]
MQEIYNRVQQGDRWKQKLRVCQSYHNVNEFTSDLNDIIKHAKEREKQRFLRSNASVQDKIAYIRTSL